MNLGHAVTLPQETCVQCKQKFGPELPDVVRCLDCRRKCSHGVAGFCVECRDDAAAGREFSFGRNHRINERGEVVEIHNSNSRVTLRDYWNAAPWRQTNIPQTGRNGEAVCQHCGTNFVPARRDAVTCSPKCRVARHRSLKRVTS